MHDHLSFWLHDLLAHHLCLMICLCILVMCGRPDAWGQVSGLQRVLWDRPKCCHHGCRRHRAVHVDAACSHNQTCTHPDGSVSSIFIKWPGAPRSLRSRDLASFTRGKQEALCRRIAGYAGSSILETRKLEFMLAKKGPCTLPRKLL